MAPLRKNVVTVFGANDPQPGSDAYETARRIGRTLADAGYAVANGGYGGTMDASARGAVEGGAHTMGVTCSLWRSEPNTYIRERIDTADLTLRVQTLIELGTAGYVVLPGATGTLVELATVWELATKGLMPPRPIVCAGEFWRPLIEMMVASRPRCDRCISIASGPADVVEALQRGD